MNKGINLLGRKIQTPVTKAVERLKLLRVIAISLLFIISVSSIVLFLLIALSPLPSLQKKEQSVLKVLSAEHSDIAKLEITKERLGISSAIIDKRNDFSKSVEKIISKMPTGLSISAVKMKNKDVSIIVSGESLSSLENFIDTLTKASDEKKDFTSVTLQEFEALAGQTVFTVKLNLAML